MGSQIKSNLTSPKHWVRLVYMVLFAFFLYIASMVMIGLVIVQFIFSLVTGSDNHKLRSFGHTLTTYIQQALLFLSFNSEYKPFPFSDWPDEPSPSAGTEAIVGHAHNPISAAELAVNAETATHPQEGPSVVDPLARQAEARGRSAMRPGSEHASPESDGSLQKSEEGPSVVDPLARKAEAKGRSASYAGTDGTPSEGNTTAAEVDEGPSVVDPLARQAEARGRKASGNALDEPFADRDPPLVDPEAEKKILS